VDEKQVNQDLLERTAETIDLAKYHSDYWTGTFWEGKFDILIGEVERDAQNDLERLYYTSLPALEALVKDSMNEVFVKEYNPEEARS